MSNQVAVYGTLRKGSGNHRILAQGMAEFLGLDDTPPIYTMRHLGGFPGIFLEGDKSIKIEVYSVDDTTFANLDRLEGFPNFYDRMKIHTKYGEAWVYYLNNYGVERPEIISGDWYDRGNS